MTEASPEKAEEVAEASAYFILDETGDSNIESSVLQLRRPEPKDDKVRGEEDGSKEEGECSTDENCPSLSDSSQMKRSRLNRSGGGDGSLLSVRKKRLRRSLKRKSKRQQTPVGKKSECLTADENRQSSPSSSLMTGSKLVPRSAIGDGPGSSARARRRGSKRKRAQRMTTPVTTKKTKPSPANLLTPVKASEKNLRTNKKKSVIVIDDSDSEHGESSSPLPDISVVEIDDESESVIVLSDDEVGVCSGSLSTAKKPLQPRNTVNPQPPQSAKSQDNAVKPAAGKFFPTKMQCAPVVEDLTGNYIKQSANAMKPAASKSSPTKTQGAPFVEDLTGNYIKQSANAVKPIASFPAQTQSAPNAGNYSKQTTQPDHVRQPANKNPELYNPDGDKCEPKTGLRPIIIDGCNVAFGHGRDRFSSKGLKICVDYFKEKGHEVRAFVPQFRKTHSATVDAQLLEALEKDGTLCFTPSRRTDGKMIVSYDDRFIVQYADATGGVIVSRDNYRDLLNENPEWKETIYKRLLMYTWVGDTIMFPKDPLGRGGPTLQEFLKF